MGADGSYDGGTSERPFYSANSSNSVGTLYVLSDNVRIRNVDTAMPSLPPGISIGTSAPSLMPSGSTEPASEKPEVAALKSSSGEIVTLPLVFPKDTEEATNKVKRDTDTAEAISELKASGKEQSQNCSCFSNTAGFLGFCGNKALVPSSSEGVSSKTAGTRHDLIFYNIGLLGTGAAIHNSANTKNTVLTACNNLCFANCPCGTQGQGAVNCSGNLTIYGNSAVGFYNNHNTGDGGAICYSVAPEAVEIEKQKGPEETEHKEPEKISEVQPKPVEHPVVNTPIETTAPTHQPGVPAASEDHNEVNSQPTVDSSSSSHTPAVEGATGRIHALAYSLATSPHTTVNVRSNNELVTLLEGAASPTFPADNSTITLKDNGTTVFLENSATGKGGAISGKNIDIQATHDATYFYKNSAGTNGGAINVGAGGNLALSADGGDIIFYGNTVGSGESSTNNSINLENTANITKLRAGEGRTVYFYDPITSQASNPGSSLTINNPDPQELTSKQGEETAAAPITYNGTIVFSGKYMPGTGVRSRSTINQPITLTTGTLHLEDGGALNVASLSQSTADSKVRMGQDTELQCSGAVSIGSLCVDMTKIDPKAVATIKTTTPLSKSGENVTISTLTLTTEETLYKDPALSTPVKQEMIVVSTPTGSTANVANSFTSSLNEHRGYQGEWSLNWVDMPAKETENPSKIAIFSWSPMGYIPFTDEGVEVTSLVPNTLWGTATNAHSLQRLTQTVAAHTDTSGFWGSAISNFLHKSHNNNRRQFRHISSGYAVGLQKDLFTDCKVVAGFCQMFGRDKDKNNAKVHTDTYAGTVYFEDITPLLPIARFLSGTSVFRPRFLKTLSKDFPVMFYGQFNFIFDKNTMTVRHQDKTLNKGLWNTRCYASELYCSLPLAFTATKGFLKFAEPFVKLQGVYANQTEFEEQGARARRFSNSYLANLSVPLGMKFYGYTPKKTLTYDLIMTYVGDVYRHNPSCTTSQIVKKASSLIPLPWVTPSTTLARQAFLCEGSGKYTINSHCSVFLEGGLDVRSSSRNYHANAGGSLYF
ncbi:polymorphic outer membrane protein middle domain-containing protein [Chlamydia ibidis]|nr:polymorphic outer membrane protein middle domain-containing protein [Chlamydia ibidis]